MNDLIEKVRQGDFRSIARVLSMIENSEQAASTAVSSLYRDTGHAHIVGITGPPGVGKSTLVNELARKLTAENRRVAIIAIDPSSPFTGGALLGDRARMQDLANHPGVFIRSMASRGNLGGLASSTSAAITVFDAAHFDVILVETVGAGQAEVTIANEAHTTLVIEAPGLGDEVQTIKAGILEIADILVVNKADRPGAMQTVKALEAMLHMGYASSFGHHSQHFNLEEYAGDKPGAVWRPQVLQTIAVEGKGIQELVEQIKQHRANLLATGEWLLREEQRSRNELDRLVQVRFMSLLSRRIPPSSLDQLVMAIVKREIDPYSAVNELFEAFGP